VITGSQIRAGTARQGTTKKVGGQAAEDRGRCCRISNQNRMARIVRHNHAAWLGDGAAPRHRGLRYAPLRHGDDR